MSRLVWPNAFLLRTCELTDAFASGVAAKIVKNILPQIPGKHVESGKEGPPVALRWCSDPLLGFPRVPFEVFRRPRARDKFESIVSNPVTFTGPAGFVEWQLREMCIVRFQAVPDPGSSLIVEAVDRGHAVIPGQRIVFTSTENGVFRSPGLAALRVVGRGKIQSVQGVDQVTYANEKDWQRIQVVGLPLTKDEAGSAYDGGAPQGIEPPSMPGLDFAKARLEIAALLHLALPPTGVVDLPVLDWPAPEPGAYLNELHDDAPSAIGLILECLANTDDLDFEKLQVKYVHRAEVEGIRQADLPNATPGNDPTQMDLPVVGVTMLSVSGDSFGATALGYGTVDFPPRTDEVADSARVPPGTAKTAFDYMVVATIVLPFMGKVDIAALGVAAAAPEAAASLTAATAQANRPPAADVAGTEAVQLEWNLSAQPQGYGVAVSHGLGKAELLNAPRGKVKGFLPFIPERPQFVDNLPPPGVKTVFVDPLGPVPLSGAIATRYLVIGLDVFGRWSPWNIVTHNVVAPPVEKPGLHAATILEDGAPAGRVVPAKIEIEFSWNWADRSPERIEFSGAFFPASGNAPTSLPNGFALNPAGAPGPNVVVRFNAAGSPAISSGHTGTVRQLEALPEDDPDQRKYRLVVEARGANHFRCDFTGVSEVGYAVFARGVERVRPTEFSAAAGPLATRFADPIPPVQPVLPVDLRWTALPDAAGRARAVLKWPAAANAAGYIVWEGTESALRHAVDPTLPEPEAGTSIFERAAALTELITAFVTPESSKRAARSMSGFARLNTELIRTTQVELELPGRADAIYAYRVSSVSTTNLESPRSNSVALFAVPRRNEPGQPRLMLRVVNDGANRGIDVIAFAGAGPRTVGFRVHRVRRTALLNDVGLMGPAKIAPDAAAWRDFVLTAPDGSVERARAILDPVAESWHPYFYRIVALGFDDPARGEFRGESLASLVQKAFLTPTAPPLLDTFLNSANATNRLLRVRTNLPTTLSPLGVAKIELSRVDAVNGQMVRTPVLSVASHELAEGGPLKLLAAPTAAQLAAMPEVIRRKPDAAGRVLVFFRVRAEVEHGAITLTDPLGRVSEITF